METPTPDPALPWNVRLEIGRAAALARTLSEEGRLCLLVDLAAGERQVAELVRRHEMSQPTVSYNLGVLRTMGLVRTRREGKSVLYSLVPGPAGGPQFVLPVAGLTVSIGRTRGT